MRSGARGSSPISTRPLCSLPTLGLILPNFNLSGFELDYLQVRSQLGHLESVIGIGLLVFLTNPERPLGNRTIRGYILSWVFFPISFNLFVLLFLAPLFPPHASLQRILETDRSGFEPRFHLFCVTPGGLFSLSKPQFTHMSNRNGNISSLIQSLNEMLHGYHPEYHWAYSKEY